MMDICDGKHSNKPKCEIVMTNPGEVLSNILKEVMQIKTCMETRLTNLELKVSMVLEHCSQLHTKVNNTEQMILNQNQDNQKICQEKHCPSLWEHHSVKDESKLGSQGSLKIVPLSEESDYPHGTWLGDPNIPSKRVRCHITPHQLVCVNSSCVTPEKMALALLDRLFTKEQLATSNISGKSRSGKKQLSPIYIFGIKLHLQYKFNLQEQDWIKIGQNIDAKCRFAYKKHMRSEISPDHSSYDKGKRGKKCRLSTSSDELQFEYENLEHSSLDFSSCVKAITSSPCELRIVDATPAHIAHLQDSREIILTEEILPHHDEKSIIMSDGPMKLETELTIEAEDDGLENPMETHISITETESFS